MKEVQFIKAVYNLNELPEKELPAIVLCGRSNVGKSSFLNSFFNRKNLAKTSSSPGKTRSLNYYLVDNKFFIVDLPGFGYAKVSKTEREKWQQLVEQYFLSTKNILLAFHFIDSRHKPTELDLLLNSFLQQSNIPYTFILSKIDKLKQSEVATAKKNMSAYFPEVTSGEDLLSYSSVKGIGKKDVLKRINMLFNG